VFANGTDNPFKCEPKKVSFFSKRDLETLLFPLKTKQTKNILALSVLQNNFVTNFMTLTQNLTIVELVCPWNLPILN